MQAKLKPYTLEDNQALYGFAGPCSGAIRHDSAYLDQRRKYQDAHCPIELADG
jgi:hypothetical protein